MFTATMWLNHPHNITPSIQMVPDGDRVNSKNESCGNARGHLGFQMFFLLLPFFRKNTLQIKIRWNQCTILHEHTLFVLNMTHIMTCMFHHVS